MSRLTLGRALGCGAGRRVGWLGRHQARPAQVVGLEQLAQRPFAERLGLALPGRPGGVVDADRSAPTLVPDAEPQRRAFGVEGQVDLVHLAGRAALATLEGEPGVAAAIFAIVLDANLVAGPDHQEALAPGAVRDQSQVA